MSDIPEGMKALRDEMAGRLWDTYDGMGEFHPGQLVEFALLAPDGPLFPALRALGLYAKAYGRDRAIDFLTDRLSLTPAQAGACLAAAEVES